MLTFGWSLALVPTLSSAPDQLARPSARWSRLAVCTWAVRVLQWVLLLLLGGGRRRTMAWAKLLLAVLRLAAAW